jgi:hypothetical protein
MSTDDDLTLAVAELAATGGPVFELWRIDAEAVTMILTELELHGVRHLVDSDGMLVVHRNDRSAAEAAVHRLAGEGHEATETQPDPASDGPDDRNSVDLVTVYTAGDLPTAELIKARLASAGIGSVLRYDPALGMAAHLAADRTVRVQVDVNDEARAREELDHDDLDVGSSQPFVSRAWATPGRSAGALALLLYLVLMILVPFVFLFGYLILRSFS